MKTKEESKWSRFLSLSEEKQNIFIESKDASRWGLRSMNLNENNQIQACGDMGYDFEIDLPTDKEFEALENSQHT